MEYISRSELVQEKENGDFHRAGAWPGWGGGKCSDCWKNRPTTRTLRAEEALEAYRGNTDTIEVSDVEVLPRVDDYT